MNDNLLLIETRGSTSLFLVPLKRDLSRNGLRGVTLILGQESRS